MTRPTKAEAHADRERLQAADDLIPRRPQRPCPNCGATQVRVTWTACCWNPATTHPPDH